jgi:hypothetical protein
MKSVTMPKRAIAIMMAVFMVAAVSTVSAFAITITDGDYTPTLVVPSDIVDHEFTYFTGDANVVVSGGNATVTIPVLEDSEIIVDVYLKGTEFLLGHEEGTVTSVSASSGYSAYFSGDNLIVTGPAADFAPALTFELYITAPGDHGPFTANLELS